MVSAARARAGEEDDGRRRGGCFPLGVLVAGRAMIWAEYCTICKARAGVVAKAHTWTDIRSI